MNLSKAGTNELSCIRVIVLPVLAACPAAPGAFCPGMTRPPAAVGAAAPAAGTVGAAVLDAAGAEQASSNGAIARPPAVMAIEVSN
jgi:hypothetical protein